MLTDKQRAILDFIKKYVSEHQYPPSVREIGKQFGVYPATVQDHIAALERKGYLQKQRFQSRALSIPESLRRNSRTDIPVVGNVAAGIPLLAQENVEDVIQLPDGWAPAGAFLLRVQGESMVNAHILDGDYVLVNPKPEAADGEIVVAMIGDEATVKRFHNANGRISLNPENPKFDPIEISSAEGFRIAGVVVGVLRLTKNQKI